MMISVMLKFLNCYHYYLLQTVIDKNTLVFEIMLRRGSILDSKTGKFSSRSKKIHTGRVGVQQLLALLTVQT